MACELYQGTLYYHPDCTKGFSYYYNKCCNVRWYWTWSVTMYIMILCLVFLCCYMCVRHSRKRKEAKKAAAIAYSALERQEGEVVKAEEENDLIKPPAPITTFVADKSRSKN